MESTSHAFLRAAAATLVVLLAVAPILVPHGAAAIGATWDVQVIAGLNGEDTSWIHSAGQSGLIGIAFQRTTSGDVGFILGNRTVGWTVKTLDISPTDPSITDPVVAKVSETTWVIAARVSATDAKTWRSTNSGSTWNETSSATFTDSSNLFLYGEGTTLYYLHRGSAAGQVEIARSIDGGQSWNVLKVFSSVCAGISCDWGLWSRASNPNHLFFFLDEGFSTGPTTKIIRYAGSEDGGGFWDSTFTNIQADGAFTGQQARMSVRGAGNQYSLHYIYCKSNGCGQNEGRLYRAAWTSDSTVTPNGPIVPVTNGESPSTSPGSTDTNVNGQGIIMASSNIRFFDSLSETPTLVHTTPTTNNVLTTQVHADRAYAIYSNKAVGGRIEVASAQVFPPVLGSGAIFCSDIGIRDFGGDPAADFGYNYVEGVVAFEKEVPNPSVDLSDGYQFEADESNNDYLGKGWSPGGTSIKVIFRIEAATEARSSVFRTALSFENLVPSATAKGNGDDTQSFDRHLAVRFKEVGNDWRMNLEYANGGVGQTQIGGSILGFNPNTPTTFSFIVDTRGEGYVALVDEDGDDILNESLTQSPTQYPGLADLAGDLMYAQWFIGAGASSNINAFTRLDDNQDTGNSQDSTCIINLLGGGAGNPIPIGSPGSRPGSGANTGPPDEPSPADSCTVGCTGDETEQELTMRGYIFVLLATVMGVTGFGFIGSSSDKLVFSPALAGIGGGLLMAMSVVFAFSFGWLRAVDVFMIVFFVGVMAALLIWAGRRRGG